MYISMCNLQLLMKEWKKQRNLDFSHLAQSDIPEYVSSLVALCKDCTLVLITVKTRKEMKNYGD